jgi:6-pyruvoyltetrahydropterin/6-carboxytetrahydropterin synthase
MAEKIAIYRKEHFNAAHRLHNDALSAEENKRLFGKCNNPNYHGHNYEVVVKLTGTIDERTGYVMDTKLLSDIVKEHITEAFDHKNLNLDVPALAGKIPTTENVALVIHDILRPLIAENLDLKIFLYETERNFVEYPA